jgi:hypothetical protein
MIRRSGKEERRGGTTTKENTQGHWTLPPKRLHTKQERHTAKVSSIKGTMSRNFGDSVL